VQRVLDQVIRAVEFLFGFTLAAGLVVLFAAVTATREERAREFAIMRAVGARASLLRQVQRAELVGVGLLAGLLASGGRGGGLGAGALCVRFRLDRRPGCRWLGALAGAVLALAAGWWGLRDVLRRPVVETLRRAGVACMDQAMGETGVPDRSRAPARQFLRWHAQPARELHFIQYDAMSTADWMRNNAPSLLIGDGYTSGNRWLSRPGQEEPGPGDGRSPVDTDTPEGLKPKDLIGIPWRLAFALQDDGWYLRSDIVWNKPNAMPESVKDRPARSHEFLFMLTKSEKYYYDWQAVREPADGGGLRNRRSVWHVNTKPFAGAHFATFPPDLIRPCIQASTEPGITSSIRSSDREPWASCARTKTGNTWASNSTPNMWPWRLIACKGRTAT
jgi:hypothetical protein